jgi:zinc protease
MMARLSVSVWRSKITALLGLLPLLACASGGGLPDEPVMKPYEPVEWVAPLKSGLRVIVKEDRSAPQVTIATSFGVGATSDPKGIEGIAHVVEHLAFRSRPGGGPQYWDVLNRIGAQMNASTSHDLTSYFTIAHKNNLHQMMQLEGWRLARTIEGVTPEVFATEREVVRNELRQRWETTANNRMFDLILEPLYPENHPLRRPVGGTHESLTAMTLEHVKTFVKDHYKPDNCTIVIAGDVDTNEVKKMLGMWPAELLFGPEGPEGAAVAPRTRIGERPVPEVPPVQKRDLQKHKGPIVQPELVLAWSLPPAYRGNDAISQFAASRLNLALGQGLEIDEDDDIEGVSAGIQETASSSVMLMSATLKPGADPEKARKRLLDVLVHAWTTEFSRIVTESRRWGSATSVLRRSANTTSSAAALAEYMTATGKTALYADLLEDLAKLKDGEVTDFAYKWLSRDRAASIYFEPEANDIPRLVGGGATASAGSPVGRKQQGEHRLGDGLAAKDANLGPEQIRQTILAPGLGAVPRFKLSNGLDVFVVDRKGAPLAEGTLRLRGGNASTTPAGAASVAVSLSSAQCRDHGSLNPVGGSMGRGMGVGSSDTSFTVLSGNLANAIAVLSDEVRCRETSEEAFMHLPRNIERATRSHEQLEKRPEFAAGKRFYTALYPNHPFSQAEFDGPKALAKLRREDAQAFVQSHFRPDNGALVVFGDLPVDEVRKESELYLSKWTGGGGTSMDPPPPPPGPSARKVFLINRPKATQASVTVGCRLADARPEWLPAFDVLEGLASERAWKLREEWGATYGVAASISRMPGNATDMTFGGAIENAQAGKSVARLLSIVGELASGSIDERLFVTKRWDAGLQYMNQMATARARANAILDAVMRRWPIDVWDKYPENLAATTPATLKEIMAPCVGKEIVAVVGDASVLGPQLEKEGLKLESE